MSDLKPLAPRISVQEYLDGETVSDVRHEYVDGEVYAMAGGTLTHNRIALNIGAALDDALDGSSRRPYIGDVKVRVETLETETFYYPDVVVTCQPDDTSFSILFAGRPQMRLKVTSDFPVRPETLNHHGLLNVRNALRKRLPSGFAKGLVTGFIHFRCH